MNDERLLLQQLLQSTGQELASPTNSIQPQNAKIVELLNTRIPIQKPKHKYDNSKRKRNSINFNNTSEPKKSRLEQKFKTEEIQNVLQDVFCCAATCITKFTYAEVENIRLACYAQNESVYITGLLSSFTESNNGGTQYQLLHRNVCFHAFLKILGISKNKFARILHDPIYIDIDRRKYKLGSKYIQCKTWFQEYLDCNADKMPDSGEYKICMYVSWRKLLHDMNTDFKAKNMDVVSKGTFQDVRNEYVLTRARVTDHFICKLCVYFKEARREAKLKKDKAVYDKLTKLFDDHLEEQSLEREEYATEKIYAKLHPDNSKSIIIDSATGKNFPSKQILPKSIWPTKDLPQLSFTGILDHNAELLHLYCRLDGNFHYDPNFILTVMVLYLQELRSKGKLPDRLHKQEDNCGKDNKNKFQLAFDALLVHLEIFSEVMTSYLIVGHTHEGLVHAYIDQRFSVLERHYREYDIFSLECFRNACLSMYDKVNVSVHFVDRVLDFKSYFNEYFIGFSGTSGPHVFKTIKERGKVVLYTKELKSAKSAWNGPYSILKGFPTGVPTLLHPIALHDDVIATMQKLVTSQEYFSPYADFWKTFLESKGTILQEIPCIENADNIFSQLQWFDETSNLQNNTIQETAIPSKKSKYKGALQISHNLFNINVPMEYLEIGKLIAYKNTKVAKCKKKTLRNFFKFGQIERKFKDFDTDEHVCLVVQWEMSKDESVEETTPIQRETVEFSDIVLSNFDTTNHHKLPQAVASKLKAIMNA